jgi:hypothetical protein
MIHQHQEGRLPRKAVWVLRMYIHTRHRPAPPITRGTAVGAAAKGGGAFAAATFGSMGYLNLDAVFACEQVLCLVCCTVCATYKHPVY